MRDGRRRGGRLGGRRDPSGSCNTEVSGSNGARAKIHNSSERLPEKRNVSENETCLLVMTHDGGYETIKGYGHIYSVTEL